MDVSSYADSSKVTSASQSATAQPQQNGTPRTPIPGDTAPVLHLLPMNGTFELKAITVPFVPDVVRIGRQTNQKTIPTAQNGYFDSKVLSRQHAEVWADREGRIFIKDVKSSNGTFVNGKRLSPENKESEPHPLKEQDVLELGIDIVSEDQKTVVHHKVAARVDHAGFSAVPNNVTELTFGEMDPSSLQLGQYARNPEQLRNRSGSQGANGVNGRYPGLIQTGNLMQAGYHMRNTQPVTVEQIVKRINTELKVARLQADDLKHTSSFVDAIVMNEKPPPPPPARPLSSSPRKSFDDYNLKQPPPPGPPPTQPLPEAPSSAHSGNGRRVPDIQPLLRRDTERPTVKPQSPIKVAGEKMQIRNLVEALSTAQKEILTQGEKLKEMEEALAKERSSKSTNIDTSSPRVITEPSTAMAFPRAAPSATTTTTALASALADTSRLSSLITSMQAEMDALRIQIAAHKTRTEQAEDSSRRDRKTLMEMVENIKKREEKARRRRESRTSKAAGEKEMNGHIGQHKRTASTSSSGDDDNFLDFSDDENSTDEDLQETLESAVTRLEKEGYGLNHHERHHVNGAGDGSLPSVAHLQALGKAALETLMPAATAGMVQDGHGSSGTSRQSGDEPAEPLNTVASKPDSLSKLTSTATATSATTTNNATNKEETSSKSANTSSTSTTLSHPHDRTALSEAAPYASLIGVVLLGVGMMAWLNGWQRVERVNLA
jgi:pSer/pThr/pTyr-binding forkhead associated (FHA) protein